MGGFFNTVLGTSGLGLTGSEQSGSQTPHLDPQTLALNYLRLNQLQGAGGIQNQGNTGLSGFLGNVQQYQNPSDYTQLLANIGANASQQPGLSSTDYYNQSLRGLDYSGIGNNLSGLYGNQANNLFGQQAGNLGYLGGLSDPSAVGQNYGNLSGLLAGQQGQNALFLQGLGQNNASDLNTIASNNQNAFQNTFQNNQAGIGNFVSNAQNALSGYQGNAQNALSNLQTAGQNRLGGLQANAQAALANQGQGNLNYINNTIAPNLVGAGQSYFNQIAAPELSNNNALLGLARSGANQEALSKGAASIAVPLSQTIAGLQGQQLGQNYAGQQALQQLGFGAQQAFGQQGFGAQQALQQLGLSGQQALQGQGLGLQGANQQQYAGLQGQNLGQYLGAYNQNALNQQNLQAQNFGQGLGLQSQAGLSNLQGQLGLQQANLGTQAGVLGQFAGLGQQNYLSNFGAQQGLGNQYLQNLFGINQQAPSNDINLQNAYLSRLGQGVGLSDYSRLQGLGASQGLLSGYLSSFNATPYTPAVGVNTTGANNTGIVTSYLGGGNASGSGAALGQAALGAVSDRNLKEHFAAFSSQEFLASIPAYEFKYKDAKHGTGVHAGIIAQDLEATKYGESLVINTPDGKYVDFGKALNLMMACLTDINKRLERLEACHS